MRQILCLLVLSLAISSLSFVNAQEGEGMTLIENNVQFGKDFSTPTITIYHEKPFTPTSSWGYTDYIYAGGDWAEILHGFYYMPGDIMYALYAGLESDDMKFRPGAYIMWNINDNMTLNLFGEYGQGEDNYWFDCNLQWNVVSNDNHDFYLQPRYRRGHGIGSCFGYTKHNVFGSSFDGFISIAPFINNELENDQFNLTLFFGTKF